MKKIEQLRLLLIDNNETPTNLQEYSNSGFELWLEVWKRTFRDLKVSIDLNSDDYLDRKMFGLFNGTEPAGLIFHRYFNLNRKQDLKHSYFNNYPEKVIEQIKQLGHSKILVSGYRTVNPNWRSATTDVPIYEVLVGITVKYFLNSDATALISYSRRDKKMHESRYRHGAKPLLQDVVAYNVGVDFSITNKKDAKQSDLPGVADSVEYFWNQHNQTNLKVA